MGNEAERLKIRVDVLKALHDDNKNFVRHYDGSRIRLIAFQIAVIGALVAFGTKVDLNGPAIGTRLPILEVSVVLGVSVYLLLGKVNLLIRAHLIVAGRLRSALGKIADGAVEELNINASYQDAFIGNTKNYVEAKINADRLCKLISMSFSVLAGVWAIGYGHFIFIDVVSRAYETLSRLFRA